MDKANKCQAEIAPISEPEEKWVSAFGWDGLYEVSDFGRVRSIKRTGETSFGARNYGGGLVTPFTVRNGYLAVNLTSKTARKQVLLHRLVLSSFAGCAPVGMECCHENGIKTDPRLCNLRWDTRAGNHADKKKHGTWQGGEKNPISKLTEEDVRKIRSSSKGIKELAEEFGVSTGCVSKVKYKSSWRHV